MVTRQWKVYGQDGHRQALSFWESNKFDFSKENKTRIVELECADKTGTNDFAVIRITRDDYEGCEDELWGQISDGFFENCRVGDIVEF